MWSSLGPMRNAFVSGRSVKSRIVCTNELRSGTHDISREAFQGFLQGARRPKFGKSIGRNKQPQTAQKIERVGERNRDIGHLGCDVEAR